MTRSLTELFSTLLPEAVSLRDTIADTLQSHRQTLVVLDDDPTGTQTVHGVPVLTTWSVEALSAELSADAGCLFVLTNSRALPPAEADALAAEIGANLQAASEQTGREVVIVSRSDSTLRGHYPNEVDALGWPDAVTVIMPFFLEGGRYTVGDVHYVADGDTLTPAAETPFAKDASFGYTQSNLLDWVVEKHAAAGRTVHRSDVVSITIEDLRTGDAASKLAGVDDGGVCVVNAVSMRDVEAFVAAALRIEASGRRLIYRTAASFVQVRAGILPRALLTGEEIVDPKASAGLIAAGSYVPKTTAQLASLQAEAERAGVPLQTVTLHVDQLLAERDAAVEQAVGDVDAALSAGSHVLLQTSRSLVTGDDAESSLQIGAIVSTALVEVVRRIEQPLRFLIAKGGITSSDVATKALGVKRAVVSGQILPGVPVWRLGDESRRPGLSYVVFPGNVGGDAAVWEAVRKLL